MDNPENKKEYIILFWKADMYEDMLCLRGFPQIRSLASAENNTF